MESCLLTHIVPQTAMEERTLHLLFFLVQAPLLTDFLTGRLPVPLHQKDPNPYYSTIPQYYFHPDLLPHLAPAPGNLLLFFPFPFYFFCTPPINHFSEHLPVLHRLFAPVPEYSPVTEQNLVIPVSSVPESMVRKLHWFLSRHNISHSAKVVDALAPCVCVPVLFAEVASQSDINPLS